MMETFQKLNLSGRKGRRGRSNSDLTELKPGLGNTLKQLNSLDLIQLTFFTIKQNGNSQAKSGYDKIKLMAYYIIT